MPGHCKSVTVPCFDGLLFWRCSLHSGTRHQLWTECRRSESSVFSSTKRKYRIFTQVSQGAVDENIKQVGTPLPHRGSCGHWPANRDSSSNTDRRAELGCAVKVIFWRGGGSHVQRRTTKPRSSVIVNGRTCRARFRPLLNQPRVGPAEDPPSCPPLGQQWGLGIGCSLSIQGAPH